MVVFFDQFFDVAVTVCEPETAFQVTFVPFATVVILGIHLKLSGQALHATPLTTTAEETGGAPISARAIPTDTSNASRLRNEHLRGSGRTSVPPFAPSEDPRVRLRPMSDDNDLTPALQQARQRRKTLHDALVHLEEATSSPAAGRVGDWANQVDKEMRDVQTAFEQHILVTEKPDGLYDEILERAPRLANNVQRLRDEHPEIQEGITHMLNRLEHDDIGGEAWPVDKARDDLQRFIGAVIRHRQKGADLVWEAYNVDIGGHE
jgi:hypothetical protein